MLKLILLLCSCYVSGQINDSIHNMNRYGVAESNELKELYITPIDASKLYTNKGVYITNHIAANFNYPRVALENGITGIIILVFIVEKDGSVDKVTVEKKLCDECDAEAIRVIKSTKYKVYKENGIPQRMQYRTPVRLVLE